MQIRWSFCEKSGNSENNDQLIYGNCAPLSFDNMSAAEQLVKLDFRIGFWKKSLLFALLAHKRSVIIGHKKD